MSEGRCELINSNLSRHHRKRVPNGAESYRILKMPVPNAMSDEKELNVSESAKELLSQATTKQISHYGVLLRSLASFTVSWIAPRESHREVNLLLTTTYRRAGGWSVSRES